MARNMYFLVFCFSLVLSKKIEIHQNCNVDNSTSCATLEEYAVSSKSSASNIYFSPEKHDLCSTVNMSHLSDIMLVGQNEVSTIVCCEKEAGFLFFNCNNVTIDGLIFQGCGTRIGGLLLNSTAALIFSGGKRLTIANTTLLRSNDAGLIACNIQSSTVLYNVNISATVASENQLSGSSINYTECDSNKFEEYNLKIESSKFNDNNYWKKNESEPTISGFMVNVYRCHANITITKCKFINNTGSYYGGNLNLNMFDSMATNQIVLDDITFENGFAQKGGGGLFVGISLYEFSQVNEENVSLLLHNLTFRNNTAGYIGGGIYIEQKEHVTHDKSFCNLTINHCHFIENHLTENQKGGIAIHSISYILLGYIFQTSEYHIVLKNSNFTNNTLLVYKSAESTSGNSVLFINSNKHFEIESIMIINNTCNAITAVASNLVFGGETTLAFNTKGSSGGGILFCAAAIMYLKPNTNIYIYNNTVAHAGGGICVEPLCLATHPRCFYQLHNTTNRTSTQLNVNISIHNNSADFSGDNLFGGDVDYCYMLDDPVKNQIINRKSLDVYYEIFNIENPMSSVTSAPRTIQFCTDDHSEDSMPPNISVFPGQSFQVGVKLVGQLNGSVSGVVQINVTNSFSIDKTEQKILQDCHKVNYTITARNTTELPCQVQLEIGSQHSGDQSGYEKLGKGYQPKIFNITVNKCPVGFNARNTPNNNGYFACNSCNSKIQQVDCNVDKSMKTNEDNIWLDFVHDSNDLLTQVNFSPHCPLDYCKSGPWTAQLKENFPACANSRNGTLCGACKQDYSTLLGSNECGKCSKSNHILLLICFAIGGIALIIILTLLNLTIFKGTLSGLIFYANIVECNSVLLIPKPQGGFTYYNNMVSILRVFVGWLNLDLAITTCFYDGMDEYAETWLNFAFPLYIWLLSFFIIVFSNKYLWVARVFGKNAVKVLATLILLSYTRFLHTTIRTFSLTKYTIINDSNATYASANLWAIDANLKYFGFKHSILFAVSLGFTIVCLPFTFILFFIKPLHSLTHMKLFKWVLTLKPFFDVYTAPYTDSARFWPGLLLLARIGFTAVRGWYYLNHHEIIIGMSVLVLVILFAVASSVRPGLYNSPALDKLEYFFLVNLCLLFLAKGRYDKKENSYIAAFILLVGLAFIVFVGIILYHIWLQVRTWKCSVIVSSKMEQIVQKLKKLTKKEEPQRALHHYPPYVQFIHDRESLLADHEE